MERELRWRPHHFEPELRLVPLFCEKEKTAIDVGANMGQYSYVLAKHSKAVIAFEPNQDLWVPLRRLVGNNVRLEAVALSTDAGHATFRLDPSNTGVATIEPNNHLSCAADASSVVSRTVETRSLDSFSFSNISIIKIDVEGHEEAVIQGAKDTLARNRPVLIIESENRHNPGGPRRITQMLSRLGYSGFYVKHKNLMEIDSLSDSDMNSENLLEPGRPYINNFLFVPVERSISMAQANECLSR